VNQPVLVLNFWLYFSLELAIGFEPTT